MTPENVTFVLYSNQSFHRFEQSHAGPAAVLKNKIAKTLREVLDANGDGFASEFWFKAAPMLKGTDFDKWAKLDRKTAQGRMFAAWNKIRKDASWLAGKKLGESGDVNALAEGLANKLGIA